LPIPSVTKTYDVPPLLTIVSAGPVGDHEDRGAERRLGSPRADAEVGHATADDQGTDAAEVIGFEALGLGRRPALEHPLVQQLAAAPIGASALRRGP